MVKMHGKRLTFALMVFLCGALTSLVPASADLPGGVRRLGIDDANLAREVCVYAVAGRPRSPIASMLLKMLRAADWSAYGA